MCMFLMTAQLNTLYATHRAQHAVHGAGPYISPTDVELLTWRDGRAAAGAVGAAPADEMKFSLYYPRQAG